MGACTRNMQSDSAEIKPAYCCIKLVFHLKSYRIRKVYATDLCLVQCDAVSFDEQFLEFRGQWISDHGGNYSPDHTVDLPEYLILRQRCCENPESCKISSVIKVKLFPFLMNMYDSASKINLHVLRCCCEVPVYFVEQHVILNYVFIWKVFMWKVCEKTQTYNQKMVCFLNT